MVIPHHVRQQAGNMRTVANGLALEQTEMAIDGFQNPHVPTQEVLHRHAVNPSVRLRLGKQITGVARFVAYEIGTVVLCQALKHSNTRRLEATRHLCPSVSTFFFGAPQPRQLLPFQFQKAMPARQAYEVKMFACS
jgi:hypothetical protein